MITLSGHYQFGACVYFLRGHMASVLVHAHNFNSGRLASLYCTTMFVPAYNFFLAARPVFVLHHWVGAVILLYCWPPGQCVVFHHQVGVCTSFSFWQAGQYFRPLGQCYYCTTGLVLEYYFIADRQASVSYCTTGLVPAFYFICGHRASMYTALLVGVLMLGSRLMHRCPTPFVWVTYFPLEV